MSIERVQRATGAVWRVRWRDEQGRNRSKVLGRKRDAEAFDAEVRRLKRTRELGHLDAGKQTLAEFGEEWWRLHAGPNLAATTRETYAAMWDTHVLPRLGGLSLRALDGERLREFRADLEADGVGPASVRKTLTLLHGVLQRAVEWGRIPSNPASMVRKPAPKRQLAISPLPPAVVERLRAQLLQRGCQRDATLVSVLAYAGLRPGEALALSWRHVGRNALLVDGAVSLGEIGNTKTGRSRTVPLLAPLGQDLSEWHLASGRPGDDALVFPAGDGTPWSRTAWQNWRRRVYAATAKDLGIQTTRPYDLRHSFVSLLIHEGRSVVEVAQQAGHAPMMTLSTYAHVFAELGPEDRVSAEEQIRRARTSTYPFRTSKKGRAKAAPAKPLQTPSGRSRIRTWDLFLIRRARLSRRVPPRTRCRCLTGMRWTDEDPRTLRGRSDPAHFRPRKVEKSGVEKRPAR